MCQQGSIALTWETAVPHNNYSINLNLSSQSVTSAIPRKMRNALLNEKKCMYCYAIYLILLYFWDSIVKHIAHIQLMPSSCFTKVNTLWLYSSSGP